MNDMRRERLAALDSFRGITVAGMIIVNTPASWAHVWWPLDHAEWNGFTPTDLVFPAFLCAMGVALGLSFPRADDRRFWVRVIRRTAALIALGWAWEMLAHPGFTTFRVFGVLPRLGLCYGLSASLAMLTARRDRQGVAALNLPAILVATVTVLLSYWALMMLASVPGYGAGVLTPEGNLASWIDRSLVGTAHMWSGGTDATGKVVYDPEGLLSTLPACANVLLGVAAAALWKRASDRAVAWIALAGVVLVALGLALDPFFPINKKLWTSSFALLTSGLSALIFVVLILAARSAAMRRALWPFDVLGMNAILGYILSLLLALAGMRLHLQGKAFDALNAAFGDPYLASFLYAVAVFLLVFALLVPLHRRGVHLRL